MITNKMHHNLNLRFFICVKCLAICHFLFFGFFCNAFALEQPAEIETKKSEKHKNHKKQKKQNPPLTANKKLYFGGDIGLPTFFNINAQYKAVDNLKLGLFISPQFILPVRMTLPAKDLGVSSGVKLALPEIVANFNVMFGPTFGGQISYSPFSSAFFAGLDFGYSSLAISGRAKTKLQVCDAQNSSPCADQQEAYTSLTELDVITRVKVDGYFVSLFFGWDWNIFRTMQLGLKFGLRRSLNQNVSTRLNALMVNTGTGSTDYGEDVNVLLKSKESETDSLLEEQLKKNLIFIRTMPILALTLTF